MKRLVILGTAWCLALAGVAALAGPVAAQSKSAAKAAAASDIGVTADEIRIAVVADVDNPLKPGLFQGTVDGVNAAVKSVNANGGVAGRKLKVDFIDSKLSPATTRNAIITACAEDFALVGTAAAFITNVDDETKCVDQAGAATGLPDLASFVTGPQQCSPVAYPVNPSAIVCSTKDQHPQTYQGSVGVPTYLQKIRGKDLHGLFLATNDSAVGQRAQDLLLAFAAAGGLKSDQHPYVSASAPQSAYTPIVLKMKSDDSNLAVVAGGTSLMLALRSEAQLQGIDLNKVVWDCYSCYDKQLPEAGAIADGVYQGLSVLPFQDGKANANLQALIKGVGDGQLDQFSVYGFAAVLLFKEAAEKALAANGESGLTRAALLTALSGIHQFDAGGLIGGNDIANRRFGPCFLVMQVQNSKWVRIHPKKPGTYDCTAKTKTLQIDQPTA